MNGARAVQPSPDAAETKIDRAENKPKIGSAFKNIVSLQPNSSKQINPYSSIAIQPDIQS